MKFLKLYLFKFSRWWKYLFFCGLFFLIGNNVFASYSENFDSYATGSLNNTANWDEYLGNGTMYVVDNVYYSPSRSVYGPGLSVSNNYDASSTLTFWVYISDGEDGSGFAGRVNFLSISTSHDLCGAGFTYTTGENFNVKNFPNNDTITSLSINTWHKIGIKQDSNFYCYIQATSTDWINTGQLSVSLQHSVEQIGIRGIEGANYLDNINTDERAGIDDIYFISPVNSSIQSLNDFYWEYNLKIASSTYWTTYDFLNVDLVFVHYTNSIADATTTLSVLREPMNTFVPNTYYNNQITDINAFPTQLGSYNAVIGLKGVYSNGTTDLLAYDTVTFGIATTTPINPTAWCSGLCNDIATATDWIGQIGNGVNCAFRSATCYIFSPHQYNLDQFNTQYNNFKLVFPFNTFFDLASTTQNAFASSTINNNQTIGLPNIRKTGTTTQYYIQPLLSSSTMASFIGSSNATLFRNTISYLLYGLTAGAIFLIIW